MQRRLIPPPAGLGRGQHYGEEHLRQLRHLKSLQEQGHSLEEIARLRQRERGEPTRAGVAEPPVPPPTIWLRLPLQPGLELHLQSGRFRATAAQIQRLRQAVREIFPGPDPACADEEEERHDPEDPHQHGA